MQALLGQVTQETPAGAGAKHAAEGALRGEGARIPHGARHLLGGICGHSGLPPTSLIWRKPWAGTGVEKAKEGGRGWAHSL